VHQQTLIDRAQDFGEIMRGRILAFCLFRAADYVQAQRQRRRLVEEMGPLYERHHVLVTAGPGPAPRLDAARAIGLDDKWEKPKFTAFFSATGGPALTVCTGFDPDGLPLVMEIGGRPFDEATVPGVGHAYQQATPHALASRIRRDYGWEDAPANVFEFPADPAPGAGRAGAPGGPA
jgi:aspartyl-tRNA(Asn)/glutamyl-tRNA(Gln) amidotransferase subunit A